MIRVPVSAGELIDKITILRIKADRIADPAKQTNIATELAALTEVRLAEVAETDALAALEEKLTAVNSRLWDIEDDIRDCERASDFGERFIALARDVYITNDKRAALKRAINEALGSDLVEEKSYAAY